MSQNRNSHIDTEKLSKHVRIQMAVDAYIEAAGAKSMHKVACQHGVRYKAVQDRISRERILKQEANKRMQRLSSVEEASLKI